MFSVLSWNRQSLFDSLPPVSSVSRPFCDDIPVSIPTGQSVKRHLAKLEVLDWDPYQALKRLSVKESPEELREASEGIEVEANLESLKR